MREKKQSIATKMIVIMAVMGLITIFMCLLNAAALTAIDGYLGDMGTNIGLIAQGDSSQEVTSAIDFALEWDPFPHLCCR